MRDDVPLYVDLDGTLIRSDLLWESLLSTAHRAPVGAVLGLLELRNGRAAMKQALGSNWTVSAWRGIGGPKGMPKDVADKLATAIKKTWDSKEFKDFAAQRGYGTQWAQQADFAAFMAKSDADMGVVMKAAGLAK